MAAAKKKRNYKLEYRKFQSSKKSKQDRASRNHARRQMVQTGRAKKGDGMDVDHVDGNPQNRSPKNLKMLTKSVNRAKK